MTPDVASYPAQPPAPVPVADLRPTADVAALVRDPQPDIPMPIPASNGQSAAITQTKVTASAEIAGPEAADPTERVLKPYGVAMLPDMAGQQAPSEEAEQDTSKDEEDVKAAEPDEAARAQTPAEAREPRETPTPAERKAEREDA